MKTLVKIVSLLVVLTGLPVVGGCAPTLLKWEEEVKLHDGQVIVVKRKEELTGTGMPVQQRGFNKYFQFCYAPMNIVWKSKPDYVPETFDIVDGKAYAKVSIGSQLLCMQHSYPTTNALYFHWDGKAWQKIDYADYPKGLRYNMLGSGSENDSSRDVHGLVTLAEKEKRSPTMYYLMKKKPEITGLNETPMYKDACKKWISSGGPSPAVSPEIFLPATDNDCN